MRRLGPSLLALVLLGCPQTELSVEPSVEPEPSEHATEPLAGVCGTPDQRFADYAWVPTDSRATTAIVRHDPELDAALTELIELVDSKTVALPIHAALGYRNLGLQRVGLDRILATLELDPGEWVELRNPAGDVVWVWPSDCPTTSLATRALDRLGVQVRIDFEHPGVRIGAGARERFPFDLLLLHERTIALAPLGRGAQVAAWMSAPRDADAGPGAALEQIEAAPIRLVISGPALLVDPDAPTPTNAGAHRKLRVTATAWAELSDPVP